MSTTIKYNISNIKQLIDLNGKAVNFQADFRAVSLSNETFDALVVTQEMLDSNEPLNYQKAEGQISGQINNDNGVYNNYFLCMKSDKPMEVEVSIRIQELPEQPQLQQQQQQQKQRQSMEQQKQIISQNQFNEAEEEEDEAPIIKKTKKSKEINYYVMGGIILLLTLLIGFTIYYYMKPKAETTAESSKVDSIIKEGFNNLENKLTKLNEVTSDGLNQVRTKVTDDFGKMHQNLYENIQELSEKITPPSDTFSDLGEIKESINNIKSHIYSKQQLPELQIPSTPVSITLPQPTSTPTLLTPSLDIDSSSSSFMHNNADEVLSRINSMKIKA